MTTWLSLTPSNVNLRDQVGNVVINYSSGKDFGALFPASEPTLPEDGLLFNNVKTQFELGFPTPFNGIGSGVSGAVLGVGSGPSGGIEISNITSTPVPEPATLLGVVAAGLGLVATKRRKYSLGIQFDSNCCLFKRTKKKDR